MAGPEVTSPRAARVRQARRLTKRAFRASDRRFLAEGPQAVREALAGVAARPGSVHELFVTADAADRHSELVAAAAAAGVPVLTVSGDVMTSLSQTVTPQGVVGVCDLLDVPLADLVGGHPRLVAVLANARDPGNAGSVVRAADAAGADGVVFTSGSVDPYNGKAVRAGVGSLWHVPVVAGPDVAATVAALRGAGLTVCAADGSGDVDLDDAEDDGRLAGPTGWLFGNEAWGLPQDVRALADLVVRVPIYGRAESLNLATAAALCLYASARAQRRAGHARVPSPP